MEVRKYPLNISHVSFYKNDCELLYRRIVLCTRGTATQNADSSKSKEVGEQKESLEANAGDDRMSEAASPVIQSSPDSADKPNPEPVPSEGKPNPEPVSSEDKPNPELVSSEDKPNPEPVSSEGGEINIKSKDTNTGKILMQNL